MAVGRIIIPNADPVYTAPGVPAVGAILTVFLTGTTTLATIYTSQAATTPMLNPQTSNAAGLFYNQSTEIWADISAAYDVSLDLGNGQIFTYNNVWGVGAPQTTTGFAPINNPIFTGTPLAPTPAANDSSPKIATTQFVTNAINGISVIPTGMMVPFAFQGGISGFLVADGSAVSRSTYARLFGVIGTTFGAGDGTTTFNLPDTGGYFVRGWTGTQTVDSGRAFGSKQTDAMQGHFHSIQDVPPKGTGYGYSGTNGVAVGTVNTTGAAITDGTNGTPRTASETRPTNIALQWLIKT